LKKQKQRFDSDLSAAIEKLCRGFVVDRRFYNDQAGGIGGGADIVDFEMLQICSVILA
jgi:hypothetical protein